MKNIQDFIARIHRHADITDHISQYDIIFWGCGNTAVLYEPCFEKENFYPRYFADNNPKLLHTRYMRDIEIISPDEIRSKTENPLIFIVSANIDVRTAIMKQCAKLGLDKVLPVDEYVFYRHEKEIVENYHLLCDELSKEVYLEMLFSRIDNNEVSEKYVAGHQYFCLREFLKRDKNEVFVDCGAFVGDSVETYLWQKDGVFNKIYAFEPDPSNFSSLCCRTERLRKEWGCPDSKIICENCGLDDHSYEIAMSSEESSLSAHLSDSGNGIRIPVTTIDDYFKEQRVSFLKADIESFETKLLCGAKNVIKRDHPLLAMCIYHNATDFYHIQQLIHKIDDTYRFSLRHHSYYECETVLYAY